MLKKRVACCHASSENGLQLLVAALRERLEWTEGEEARRRVEEQRALAERRESQLVALAPRLRAEIFMGEAPKKHQFEWAKPQNATICIFPCLFHWFW